MNAPQALAALSLFLLLASRVADIYMERIDLPLFRRQLLEYKPLKIAAWFGDEGGNKIGEGRIKIVLRMAVFSATVRTIIVSLVMGIFSLIWTLVIIFSAQPAPPLRDLRGILSAVFCVLAVIALVILFAEMVTAKLTPTPVAPQRGWTMRQRISAYFRRLSTPKYLTPYLTLTWLIGVLGVFASLGI
ncbi:hypothetical protein [Arthrobacter sp. MAHUQ-56]